jgi:3-hydroxybutyryl-CoA dehydrogenase
MKIIVITDEDHKSELIAHGVNAEIEILFISALDQQMLNVDAFAIIDLLYKNEQDRIEQLSGSNALIIVNAVTDMPANKNWVRINGWKTLLSRPIIECSCENAETRKKAETVFNSFNKRTEWTAAVPGFVTARVISTIINEAYYTLGDKVSSKEEIDIAMKLGTNYPYGPFEWASKIGIRNIWNLLDKLSGSGERYIPAPRLTEEAK